MTESSGTYTVSAHRGIVFLVSFAENLNSCPFKKKSMQRGLRNGMSGLASTSCALAFWALFCS